MPRGKFTKPSELVMFGPHFQEMFGGSRSTQLIQIEAGDLPRPFQISAQKKGWLKSTLIAHFAKLEAAANPEPEQENAA